MLVMKLKTRHGTNDSRGGDCELLKNAQQESCLIRRAYWKCNWGCGVKDGRLLKIGYAIITWC